MFNIQNFYIIPTECIYAVCMNIIKNSDLFPTDSLLIDFMTGTKYVYCAVGTEYLNIQHFIFQIIHTTLKKVELLKHFKIRKTAPTCFSLQENHHQGATVST